MSDKLDRATLEVLVEEISTMVIRARNNYSKSAEGFLLDMQCWLQDKLNALPKDAEGNLCLMCRGQGLIQEVGRTCPECLGSGFRMHPLTPAPAIPPDLAEALKEWRANSLGSYVRDLDIETKLAAAYDAAKERGEL